MTEPPIRRWRSAMRRRAASIRVRIVFGYLVLLTTALTIAVVVTRQVQINRVERDIETEQLQEVEEISLLAADGRDPDTGEPFGNDVAAIFDTYLGRNIPLDDEDYYTLVHGEEYEPSRGAPDLYGVTELMDSWRVLDESTTTRLETEFGEVWSLAVPVTDGDGNELGVFAVVSFPDDAIARAHRGMASAASVPGHGATVTLTLPSDPDSTKPGELPPPDGDMTT